MSRRTILAITSAVFACSCAAGPTTPTQSERQVAFAAASIPLATASTPEAKIAPSKAAPPHPFTIIDAFGGRLLGDCVALFTLNGAIHEIVLRTHGKEGETTR